MTNFSLHAPKKLGGGGSMLIHIFICKLYEFKQSVCCEKNGCQIHSLQTWRIQQWFHQVQQNFIQSYNMSFCILQNEAN